MSRLPFELFLGLRYLRPRRTFVSVLTVISILGVTLGVAVLVIVIAVMAGFDREWRTRILSFSADIEVSPANGLMRDFALPMRVIESNRNVTGVAPFVLCQVLMEVPARAGTQGEAVFRAPLLRGVDPVLEGRVSVLTNSIKMGAFDLSGRSVLVGIELARDTRLHVGDHVSIYSPHWIQTLRQNYGKANAEAPLPDDYTVKGIFDVGFNDFNAMTIVTSLENAQELYRLNDGQVHGLYVRLNDSFQADAMSVPIRQALNASVPPEFASEDLADLETLALRLRQGSDPVAGLVWRGFAPATREQVSRFVETGTNRPAVVAALVRELNTVVQGPALYSEEVFKGARLPAATKELVAAHPTGASLARLNWRLLVEAWPGDLAATRYQVVTWTEKYGQLFATLMGEKNMMYYILFFITIVAAFGITNSQITFVVHKTREIGLLKGLGASGRQIMLLFLSQSVVVGITGVVLGLGMGLTALAWRNEFLHLMNRVAGRNLLPEAIYQIGELPCEILPGDLAIICGGSFLICLLAGLLPAWKAGRLNPVEALRYE